MKFLPSFNVNYLITRFCYKMAQEKQVLEILKGKFELQYPKLFGLTYDKFFTYDSSAKDPIKEFKNKRFERFMSTSYHLIPVNSFELIVAYSATYSIYLVNLITRSVKTLGGTKPTYHNQYLSGVVISPSLVALVNKDGILHLWNFRENKLVNKFRIHDKKSSDVHYEEVKLFLSEETLLCFDNYSITGWSVDTLGKKKPKRKFNYEFPNEEYIIQLVTIPNTCKFITITQKELQVWSFSEKEVKEEFKIKDLPDSGQFVLITSLSGQRFVVGRKTANKEIIIQIYNSDDYSLLYQEDFHFDLITTLVEISDHLIISGKIRTSPGFKTISLDLKTKNFKELDFSEALLNSVVTPVFPDHNRVIKCVLLLKLDKNLPKDLINEAFSFF